MKNLRQMSAKKPTLIALCVAVLTPAVLARQSAPERSAAPRDPVMSHAQMPPAPPAPTPPQPPPQPPLPPPMTPPARPTPPPAPPREPGQPVNVRIEVTIADQRGSAAPTKKTVSMTVADGEGGMVRSVAVSDPAKGTTVRRLPLHIDARPSLIEGGKVRLRMSLEYDLLDDSGNASFPSSEIRESLALVLESGQPMVVAQSADAVTDRRVTVEVKATVLRDVKK